MHELSIAMRVVETLSEDLAEEPGDVVSVRLAVGGLSGVVPDALRFAWDVACRDSRLDGSVLEIEEVAVQLWCEACQSRQTMPDSFKMCCPACGQVVSEIVGGRELEILSVEMTEDEQTQAD